MHASLFSKLRPSLRSLATVRPMQLVPPTHVGRPLARLSCRALHSNATGLQPRACGLLGGRQPPKRGPSVARRLLSSQSPRDPYSLLGVPRSADQATIKQAYFRAAKRNHPDVDKSPGAALRFREVSEAYDLLRDPARRSAFDAGGGSGGSGQRPGASGGFGGGPRPGQRPSRPRQWEDEMFRNVWSDLGMADIDNYIERVQRELQVAVAVSAAASGDTRQAWQFASDHRFLLVGTIVPVTLLLRSPAASLAVLRLIGPLIALGRFLPPRLQWRLFSRMWVGAILYLERAVGHGSTGGSRRRR